MLIKCPECNNQVSDKALACPHCGYPININQLKQIRRTSRKRRLPNGFGQITELKNRNLKKPFRAMITVGFNDVGKPIQKLLKPRAYFESYNLAYEALLKYNNNPYSFNSSMTLKELYELWEPEYIKKIGNKTSSYINPAWNRLKPLWDITLHDLRKAHIKKLFNEIDATPVNINNMKRLLKLMLDYAVEYEIINENVASNIDMSDAIINKTSNYTTKHRVFTDYEISILWQNSNNNLYAKYILIQCYMGWRPTELLTLTKENINLKEGYIIGGMKTKSGTNRKVPIHSAIYKIIEELYYFDTGLPFLLYTKMKNEYRPVLYITYMTNFIRELGRMNLNVDHKAHDPRVTFVTLCKNYQVNEYAIKYMIGHKITDLTENTYTKRNIEWLKSEIEKIKVSDLN